MSPFFSTRFWEPRFSGLAYGCESSSWARPPAPPRQWGTAEPPLLIPAAEEIDDHRLFDIARRSLPHRTPRKTRLHQICSYSVAVWSLALLMLIVLYKYVDQGGGGLLVCMKEPTFIRLVGLLVLF
jgi:hypothetical protein